MFFKFIEKVISTKNYQVWFTYCISGIFLMLLGAFSVSLIRSAHQDILNTGAISQLNSGVIRLDINSSRFILRSGIPVLEQTSGEDDPFRLLHFNWAEFYWKIAANIRQATPREILKAQFPTLAIVKPKAFPPFRQSPQLVFSIPTEPDQPPLTELTPILSAEPQILIYHSHTSESYIPESGKTHITNEHGDIVKVGAHLKKLLEEQYGIKTIHSEEIHDYYPFRESYLRSQVTLKNHLAKYPSLQLVLDVHRDATPGINAVCKIKGDNTATVMLVVGTDKMGLAHPEWKKNHEYALSLSQAMNQYYPGLNSGIIVSDARYNQHLHNRAIILEIGDQNSTLEEAFRAIECLAPILASTLKTAAPVQ